MDESQANGTFCGSISAHEGAMHPPVAGRYTLYLTTSCPFAARAWLVYAFYGLESAIRLVRCFPVIDDDGWFFQPKSDREKSLVARYPDSQYDSVEPLYGVSHLSDLVRKAKNSDKFSGRATVPLLWDNVTRTVVSDSSIDIARMLAIEMRHLGSRNKGVELFPDSFAASWEGEHTEDRAHSKLVDEIHAEVSAAVYTIHACQTQREHRNLVDNLYRKLDALEMDLSSSPFLMGDTLRFLDFVLFSSLVRFDLSYQWAFRLGRRSIQNGYPFLWRYTQRIYALPGISSTVFAVDIMRFAWLSRPLRAGAGETVPAPPDAWLQSLGQYHGMTPPQALKAKLSLVWDSFTVLVFVCGFMSGLLWSKWCISQEFA